ncbi:MAG: DUF2207 domain-containing protein [Candidatus Pacebacteria bacterium]|nr:DUF2207 domain-containing protein [Candidatus Paceibacterota bacterium]
MFKNKRLQAITVLILTTVFSLSFIVGQALARENVDYWYIKDFKSTIEILENDSAIITEDIIADCGQAKNKHGIFRIVPTKSTTPEGVIYTPVELISITDFQGKPYNYQTQTSSGTITWKIGSANITVSGENNYRIKYKVKNVIREQKDFDEFYWNLSGNYWDLEIDNFQANIILPEGINKSNSEIYLYSGKIKSNTNNISSYNWINENALKVISKRTLQKGEGITLSISFPKSYITHQEIDVASSGLYKESKASNSFLLDPKTKDFVSIFLILGFLILPIIVLIVSLIAFKKRQRKNPYRQNPIVVQYSPPEDISPLMMGFLQKRGVKPSLITASIVNMAVLGLLTIKEKEKKILFLKTQSLQFTKTTNQANYEKLDEGEKYIFNLLFNNREQVSSGQLQRSFQNKINTIQQKVRAEAKEKGYLEKQLNSLEYIYLITAIITLLVGSIPTFIILIIFYTLTRNLTEKGYEIIWKIKGFKDYMTIAEKERHAFYEKENIFTKLLPYAIALGTIKEWVSKMENIYGKEYIEKSFYWYAGASGLAALNSVNSITSNIDSITKSINSSVGTSSGAGGGGFSGGGSGGGGGGGW